MQHGDALEISAELVDARDNSHIWGQQYSRKASDIFALQGDLAKEMTSMLRMRLTGEAEKQMMKTYTANPEAYQDYLKGRYWWNKRTADAENKAIDYFQQAIAKDPNYALAYDGLADVYNILGTYNYAPPKEVYPKAKEAALKALQLDDTLAEAHTSLAFIKMAYDLDWTGAEKELQRAFELNPNYAYAHVLHGINLRTTGRLEEAIAEEKRAVELDPLSLIGNRELGFAFYMARQYDLAIEQFRKTLELDPNFTLTREYLGSAYLQKNMYLEALTEFRKAFANSPDNVFTLSELGYAYAKSGRKAEALKVLDQLNELSKRKFVPAICAIIIYVGLGEKDKVFEWLEKAYEDRSLGGPLASLKVDPLFDPLRSDPRFADLLRRMNLQP
jgi:tetratricopeptide (TPR) repeat protein